MVWAVPGVIGAGGVGLAAEDRDVGGGTLAVLHHDAGCVAVAVVDGVGRVEGVEVIAVGVGDAGVGGRDRGVPGQQVGEHRDVATRLDGQAIAAVSQGR